MKIEIGRDGNIVIHEERKFVINIYSLCNLRYNNIVKTIYTRKYKYKCTFVMVHLEFQNKGNRNPSKNLFISPELEREKKYFLIHFDDTL